MTATPPARTRRAGRPRGDGRLLGEGGYLWELPLLVLGAALLAAIVTPLLPASWSLVPTGILVVVFAVFLVYNFLCPGWLPRKRRR